MGAKIVYGLDIGSSSIKLTKLELDGDNATLVDYKIESIKPIIEEGVEEDIVDEFDIDVANNRFKWNEDVYNVIKKMMEENNIGKKPVCISIPGSMTLFRDFPLPRISPSKMREVVAYEARQQIPYPLESVLWDYHVQDLGLSEIIIHLVCCRRDYIEDLLEMVSLLNINIVGVQPSPVSVANFLRYDSPSDSSCLALDSGSESSDFIIINQDSFWLRNMPIAGNDITKALMEKLLMSFEETEKLKSLILSSSLKEKIYKVTDPVFESLFGEIHRSLGYYKSLYGGGSIESCICAGGMFKYQGSENPKLNFNFPTSMVKSFSTIKIGENIDRDKLVQDKQLLVSSIGLALQSAGRSNFNINLKPRVRSLMSKLIDYLANYKDSIFNCILPIVAIFFIFVFVGVISYIKKQQQQESPSRIFISESGNVVYLESDKLEEWKLNNVDKKIISVVEIGGCIHSANRPQAILIWE